ncbi:hypothetical protein M0811_11481 [Anaeramoeba ignava]|uniref:Calcineurin-like phosphoesterase domain-containing protein n=1 Tax=Anaeramoeba ignava TaxID=1746090 RepID=A0A9Q0R7A7_ANAIG|nr:hypothetical protein M0811_11481 [Anaeramoeba ignava]
MISIFSTLALPISIFAIVRARKKRLRLYEHGYYTLALLFSTFEYNFYFEPFFESQKCLWIPTKFLTKLDICGSGIRWIFWVHSLFIFGFISSFFQSFSLSKSKMPSKMTVFFLSIPSGIFSSVSLLSFLPILVFRVLFIKSIQSKSFSFIIAIVFFIAALIGSFQSLFTSESVVDLFFDPTQFFGNKTKKANQFLQQNFIQKMRKKSNAFKNWKDIKIIQITDPHLGLFMSVPRLKKICERTVERNPDLVLITGDLFTKVTKSTEGVIGMKTAFSPLKKMKGKVFACFGNHDYEMIQETVEVLNEIGAQILKDSSVNIKISSLKIQIVGLDFYFRNREQQTQQNCIQNVCEEDVDLRIILLHNPQDFPFIPNEDKSITFSGHTHGGHIGLNFIGLPFTLLGLGTLDQGVFVRNHNLCYVHKGTGFYGFPIRYGVSGEQSLVNLHFISRKETKEK